MEMDRLLANRQKRDETQKRFDGALHGHESLRDAVEIALGDLRFRRSSIFEMPPVRIDDDLRFDQENPEHPEALSNRFVRIDAANFFYRLATNLTGQNADELGVVRQAFQGFGSTVLTVIDDDVLGQLHEALFDRDAAVRLTVVETLAVLARPASASQLERLVQSEDESALIRSALPEALVCCETGVGRLIRPRV